MSTIIEAVAHYQRVGDGAGAGWLGERLEAATATGQTMEPPDPERSPVLGEWQGGWVQVLLFTYRFAVTDSMDGSVPFEVAKALAQNLAETIVGEADVQVLGMKVIEPDERITPESAPAGTRVRCDEYLGVVAEWQGSGIVVVQYDDGTRSIGAVHPGLRVVTE